jgi:hypothetical protein
MGNDRDPLQLGWNCIQMQTEWDPVFDLPEQHGRNRNTAAEKMRECAAACVRLCEGNFEINDTMVICMKNSTRLQSIIISDESELQNIRTNPGIID